MTDILRRLRRMRGGDGVESAMPREFASFAREAQHTIKSRDAREDLC
jgi:hypothetical protein